MTDISLDDARKNLDVIEHHGVKGQKWGVIRRGRSGGSGKAPKANRYNPTGATTAQILKARQKVTAAGNKMERDIAKIENHGRVSNTKAEVKKINEIEMKFLNNPDRVTAATLTKGEKATRALFGNLPIIFNPSTEALGVGSARRIQKRQQKGTYNR